MFDLTPDIKTIMMMDVLLAAVNSVVVAIVWRGYRRLPGVPEMAAGLICLALAEIPAPAATGPVACTLILLFDLTSSLALGLPARGLAAFLGQRRWRFLPHLLCVYTGLSIGAALIFAPEDRSLRTIASRLAALTGCHPPGRGLLKQLETQSVRMCSPRTDRQSGQARQSSCKKSLKGILIILWHGPLNIPTSSARGGTRSPRPNRSARTLMFANWSSAARTCRSLSPAASTDRGTRICGNSGSRAVASPCGCSMRSTRAVWRSC
jgi:hypothetical protein